VNASTLFQRNSFSGSTWNCSCYKSFTSTSSTAITALQIAVQGTRGGNSCETKSTQL